MTKPLLRRPLRATAVTALHLSGLAATSAGPRHDRAGRRLGSALLQSAA